MPASMTLGPTREMRIRTIKPEFWQSESLSRVSRESRLLFIGLFSACDDSGKTRAASRFLASLLFPYDEDAPKAIEGWLAELEAEGCIRRYVVEGNTYLEIPKWREHQKIDKPSASKLPPFAEGSRAFAEASRTVVVGSGIRDQGSGTIAPAGAVAKEARKEPAPRPRNELLDALASVDGVSLDQVTRTKWGEAAKALADICEVCPAVTVDEIRKRARNYRTHYPNAASTPSAIAKHWATCERDAPSQPAGAPAKFY